MNIKPSTDKVKDRSANSEERAPKEQYRVHAPTAEWYMFVSPPDTVARWDGPIKD